MKNKRGIIILVVLLAIGFAAVSTTLVINGVIGLSFGELDVYYSKAVINGTEDNTVIKDKTHIEFDTTMTLVGEKYEMDYDVTNGSRNYDADIKMECNYETEDGGEYLALENKINTDSLLKAMTTRTGHLTIKMIKAVTEPKDIHITCELKATPQERDEDPGDEITKEAVTLVETIMSKANEDSINNYNDGNKGEVYAFNHAETAQLKANTDYRYIGNVPNNYIMFDNELWRVIGVFEDENGVKRAKIMRDKFLEYNSYSLFKWDEQGNTNYTNSDIYKRALKRAMSDGALEQTDEINYYLGGSTNANQSAELFYNDERSSHNLSMDNSARVKVGLPYVSDYYYTYGYGVSETCFDNPSSCVENQSAEDIKNSWIYDVNYIKFINSYINGGSNFYVNRNQGLNIQSISEYAYAKETVYLKADIVSMSGDGSESNPYVIESHDSRDTISSLTNSNLNSNDVERITFVNDEPRVPENAILSWDASDAKNGSIVAYTLDEDGNNKYELYIVKKGKVYASYNKNDLFSFSNVTTIDGMKNFSTKNVDRMYRYFSYLRSVTSLDLSGLDTSLANNMAEMFSYCTNLEHLDVSGWDTSNVTTMRAMFDMCEKLKSIDLSTWDTSNVADMSSMFQSCYSIEEINLNGLDTRNVTNMARMFNQCKMLEKIELSNFNTSKVTNMSRMFVYCTNLKNLDISNFDTSKVRDMSHMFDYCTNLNDLDISDFTYNGVNADYMFAYCYSLTTTINIPTASFTNYDRIFLNTAKNDGAQLTVNYSTSSESFVDYLLNQKDSYPESVGTANVVKGNILV